MSITLRPIVERELRSHVGCGRLQRDRLSAAAIAVVTLLALAISERWVSGFNLARVLRMLPLSSILPFGLLVIGLSRAQSLLTTDRREGTLPLLLLTHLSGYDIVLAKVLQALVFETSLALAGVPAAILPSVAVGLTLPEVGLAILGCLNVLFFGLALGLLISVVADGPGAQVLCAWIIIPWLVASTPIGTLIPLGGLRETITALQIFNPCDALAHLYAAAAGFRPADYWRSLLASHGLAWGLLALAGFLLPKACRRQAALGVRPHRYALWRRWWVHGRRTRLEWRRRMLNRNAFYWLVSREVWPTTQVWLLLAIPSLLWIWLTWLTWSRRGLNVTVVWAVAAAASWLCVLVPMIPREASRQLIQDRQTGALELLLCTPLDTNGIVRGQWLALIRRFWLPLCLVIALSTALMIVGYATFGFGGMLDPEDRGLWLFSWSTAILLLPLNLMSLSWVAMSRAISAKSAGEATGWAVLQVLGLPAFAVWILSLIGHWIAGDPGWGWTLFLILGGFVATPSIWAWRARTLLRTTLREAAATPYSGRRSC